jgi:aminoglycoside 2''-phosphotransferase
MVTTPAAVVASRCAVRDCQDVTVASTDRETIEGLISMLREAGAIHDVGKARLISDGMQNRVLVIDEQLIARFPRSPDAQRALAEEHRVLAWLRNHVSAPLPQPISVADEFAVYRMLRGEPITRAALACLDRHLCHRLIDDIAQFMAEMHSAPLPDDLRASSATKALSAWMELRDRAHEVLTPLLWSHQRQWLDDLFRHVQTGELSLEFAPAMIHGDLASYHLLHDPKTAQLTGILDFGVAGRGDPAVDLACLLSVWGERWANGLVREYPQLTVVAHRARFMAAAMPVEWAVIGLEQNKPDMLVAHLGHAATDLGEWNAPFGSDFTSGELPTQA